MTTTPVAVPSMERDRALRIVCLSAHEPSAMAIAALVATIVEGAEVETADLGATSESLAADLFVIDATGDAVRAEDLVRLLHARGTGTPAVVVVPAHAVHEDVAARGGEPRVVAAADLADELPNVVSDVLRLQDGLAESPTMAAIARSLADTRQLLAAGQIARRVRHDLNNPLAAMLAEAQLLEMDAASTDDRDAAGRLLELCRRLVTIVGRLEGPASHSSG